MSRRLCALVSLPVRFRREGGWEAIPFFVAGMLQWHGFIDRFDMLLDVAKCYSNENFLPASAGSLVLAGAVMAYSAQTPAQAPQTTPNAQSPAATAPQVGARAGGIAFGAPAQRSGLNIVVLIRRTAAQTQVARHRRDSRKRDRAGLATQVRRALELEDFKWCRRGRE